MPLAPTQRTSNPIFRRLASDGLFGAPKPSPFAPSVAQPGPSVGELNAMNNAGVYQAGTHGAINAEINRTGITNPFAVGMPSTGQDMTPLPTGREGVNMATGNIFGIPPARGVGTAIASAPVAVQVAGELAGLDDAGRVAAYQQRLAEAGINLDPSNQTPGDYQAAVGGARGLYDQVFGGGLPQTSGPVQSFAPTGLRDQAIAAGGAPVWGQGDVLASAVPKSGGGTAFSLMQASRTGGAPGLAASPTNPIAPQAGTGANPLSRLPVSGQPQPSAYQANAQAFRDHVVSQQTAAGLSKGLEPGYMIDPEHPNAVKPIPGSMAELKLKQAQQEMTTKQAEGEESQRAIQEAGRQAVEKAQIVTKTINKIIPQLDRLTTGPIAALTEAIPGTPAYNVGKLKDTVVANIGLKELKSMKEASKNGASGMGALSEKELAVLETSLGNLKLGQDTKQVAQAMRDVRNSFYRWRATYKAGQGNDPQRIAAVKWALSHEKDPRAEQILAMDDQ